MGMKILCVLVEWLLGLSIITLHISIVLGATHKHLGCWMDTTAAPDLDDLITTPEQVSLAVCVTSCNTAGYAYAGIKKAEKCLCGNKYGTHDVSTGCNYTCEGIPCGGVDPNDIYYAVDTDIVTRTRRDFYGFNEAKTYENARKECIKGNGDLVVLREPSYFNQLQIVANKSGITSDLVWIGLFWNSDNQYIWTDPSVNGLAYGENGPYWRSGESFSGKCVLLSISGKDWITASCNGEYPYICYQLPPDGGDEVTAPPDDTEFVEEEEDKGFLEDNKKVVFFVVLPLFVFCYGGSCIVYAIGKGWRYFKRRKREKAREAMLAHSTEFEPDTKPLTLAERIPEKRPLTQSDVKMEESNSPPPPYYRVNSRASKQEKERPMQTPNRDSRFEDGTKPHPQSRVESRRSALLENAYMEAKERRKREGQTPEPQYRPRSSRSPRLSQLDTPAVPPKLPSPKPPRRADQYKVYSPPPVIPEGAMEADIDYTKLSINDIMYIRGLMATDDEEKRKRKKPKKIIVA